MNTPSPLADCCETCNTCWPGDNPATAPHTVVPEPLIPGSLRAEYRCEWGHEWVTWWDADAAGWPLERRAA